MSGSIGDNPYRASGVVAAAAGAGGVSWQAVTTGTTLTAVAGNGYPINTTSNVCTITLPAAAAVGDQIIFTDYARTWSTYAVTINPNSLNYQGNTTPQPVYDTDGESIHIVYMDATKGWVPTYDGAVALETPQTYTIDLLVVAGGGAGGYSTGGGGGAGGFRTATSFTINGGTVYTITVGDGGTAPSSGAVVNGSDASITGSDITDVVSAGGGGGGNGASPDQDGGDGGSGGGAFAQAPGFSGGSGDTPATSPAQGTDGGDSTSATLPIGGGGGGASQAGTTGGGSSGGDGGNGTADSISGSSVTYAGGGGGGQEAAGPGPAGGTGGGGRGGANNATGAVGSANLGGGGGGGGYGGAYTPGGNGGKGVVILRMADAKYSSTTTGSPTVATDVGGSGETTVTFTGTGSYTG